VLKIFDQNSTGNTLTFQLLLNSLCTASRPSLCPPRWIGRGACERLWGDAAGMLWTNQGDIPYHTMSCSATTGKRGGFRGLPIFSSGTD